MAWIASDDADVLLAIFQNLPHLSQLDAAQIAGKFSRHNDPAIRLEVALAAETDIDWLELLCGDEDIDVLEAAANALRTRTPIAVDNDRDI